MERLIDIIKDDIKNIMIGVWYISFLTERFNGNLNNIIAAYNAGPTNVLKWLDGNESGDLVNIPFDETRKYTEKVNYTYDMYLKIYG